MKEKININKLENSVLIVQEGNPDVVFFNNDEDLQDMFIKTYVFNQKNLVDADIYLPDGTIVEAQISFPEEASAE